MKITGKWWNKVVLTMFFLLIIGYDQCGYAAISLYPDESGRRWILLCDIEDGGSDGKTVDEKTVSEIVNKIAADAAIYGLNFRSAIFTPHAFATILDALQRSRSVMAIDFRNGQLDNTNAVALAAALERNEILTTLDIRDNQNIGFEGYFALLRALGRNKNRALTNLYINNVDFRFIQELARLLPEENITVSNLIIQNIIRSPNKEQETCAINIISRFNQRNELIAMVQTTLQPANSPHVYEEDLYRKIMSLITPTKQRGTIIYDPNLPRRVRKMIDRIIALQDEIKFFQELLERQRFEQVGNSSLDVIAPAPQGELIFFHAPLVENRQEQVAIPQVTTPPAAIASAPAPAAASVPQAEIWAAEAPLLNATVLVPPALVPPQDELQWVNPPLENAPQRVGDVVVGRSCGFM